MPKFQSNRYSRKLSDPTVAAAAAADLAKYLVSREGCFNCVSNQNAVLMNSRQMAVLAFMATMPGSTVLSCCMLNPQPMSPHAPTAAVNKLVKAVKVLSR